jgi:hypothetical protein
LYSNKRQKKGRTGGLQGRGSANVLDLPAIHER